MERVGDCQQNEERVENSRIEPGIVHRGLVDAELFGDQLENAGNYQESRFRILKGRGI